MFKVNKVAPHIQLIIGITIIAAIFRAWGTFDYQQYFGDESIDVPAAKSYIETGLGNWKYPYLKSIIFALDMRIFGDNSFGWRIDNVIWGTLTIVLAYLITQRLYNNHNISLVASAILAFDPFTIHFCRQSVMEIPVLFFFMTYAYLLLEYSENQRNTLTGAGIALGLTIATKAYFIFAIPLVGCYCYYYALRNRNAQALPLGIEFIIKLVILPISIYLLTHILWFGRGHTFGELILMKYDTAWVLNHWNFVNASILHQGGKPWEWFIKAFSFGHQLSQDGEFGRFVLQINNPLIRLLVFPSAIILTWHAISTRNLRHFFPAMVFFSSYILFFLVKRDVNSYSSLVLLPFAYMMIAKATHILSSRHHYELEVTAGFLVVVVAMGIYLFPVAAGFPVPIKMYQHLIDASSIMKVF